MVETRNQKELKVDQDIIFDEVTSMDMTKAKGDGAVRRGSSLKGKASTKSRGGNLGDSGAAAAAMIAESDGWEGFLDGLPRSGIETDELSNKDIGKVLCSVSEDVRLTVQSESSIKASIMILYEMLMDKQIGDLEKYNKECSDPFVQECIRIAKSSLQRRYWVAGSETGGNRGVGVVGGGAGDVQVQGEGGGAWAVEAKGATASESTYSKVVTNGRNGVTQTGKHSQVNTDARNYNNSRQHQQLPGPSASGAMLRTPMQQGSQQQQQVASGTPQRTITAADIEFRNKIDQRRKYNIMVMGVPETNIAGEDERFIKDMLYYMNCGRAVDCIINIARLGKFKGKRRLVKVDFNDTRAAKEVLDYSYYLAGSWYGNIYIKTDRTFAEREQLEKSKTSHTLAQAASGANGYTNARAVADQAQRGGKQSRWETAQTEKGDSRSGPDLDHSQGRDDKVVANSRNTGVQLTQNIGKVVNEMRPKVKQGMENPLTEGGRSQDIVKGPQDQSDGGDIWHLASEGDEIEVGRGLKPGDRGDNQQHSKTGVSVSVNGGEVNLEQTSKVSTPTREKGERGFFEKVR